MTIKLPIPLMRLMYLNILVQKIESWLYFGDVGSQYTVMSGLSTGIDILFLHKLVSKKIFHTDKWRQKEGEQAWPVLTIMGILFLH